MTRIITLKIAVLVCLLLTLAIGLNGFLSVLSFEKKYKEFLASKVKAVGLNVKHTLDYGMNLGMEISEMSNLNQIFAETLKENQEFVSLTVTDSKGKVIHHSMPSEINKTLPLQIGGNTPQAENSWTIETKNTYGLVFPLVTNFDTPVGYFVVFYSKDRIEAVVQRVTDYLFYKGLYLAGVFFIFAFSLSNLHIRTLTRFLVWCTDAFENLHKTKRGLFNEKAAKLPMGKEFAAYQEQTAALYNETPMAKTD